MRALGLAAVLAGAILAASPALAEDPPAPAPAAHGDAAAPAAKPLIDVVTRFRAIDVSAMFEKSHGGQHDVDPVALAERGVTVLVPGGKPIELRTDSDGRLVIPENRVHAEDVVQFLVPGEGAERWPAMVGTPVRIGPGQPGEVGFVRVHDGADPLVVSQLLVTATVPGREDGTPSFRVNLFAAVANTSDAVWIGPRGAIERGTFRLRVPDGFTVVGAQVSGEDVPWKTEPRPDGGTDVVFTERFYPTSFSDRPQMVRVTATGPYPEHGVVDLSFRTPHAIDDVRVNLETGVLHYDDSGDADVSLASAGANPPIEGRAPTDAWTAKGVAAGSTLGIRITTGHRVNSRVWWTLGALGAVMLAAGGLAIAVHRSRSRGGAAASPRPEANVPPVRTPDDRAARLAELDERLRRGEITSFEHSVRRRQLDGATAPVPAAPRPSPAAAPGDTAVLDEIEARVATADAETLRGDVRSLLRIARRRAR